MPLYEYQCDECGIFSAIRKMSESSQSVICETCGGNSERIISVPHFALLTNVRRIAYERNEKSAHAPQTMRRSSCGCTGSHTCSTTGKLNGNKEEMGKSNPQSSGFQMQTKRTARPWMLGH